MEEEVRALCQQANVVNLNCIVAKTACEELQAIDSVVSRLESRVAQLRANLQEEAALLEVTSNAAYEIICKVKNRPMASALKRLQPSVTPSRGTPGKLKAVSFDIKSSPLSLCSAADSQQPATVNTVVVGLSQEEFDQIPKYMKGRLTLEKMSVLVEQLNQLYTDKYAIMCQNPSRLGHEHRQRYWDWKEAECDEVQERHFVTEADIKSAMQAHAARQGASGVFKLDPLGRSILAILRHFGRIREVRTPGVVRFVIL